MKRLSFEEQFKIFKEDFKEEELNRFLARYIEFKKIEEGLYKEKMEEFNNAK